MPPISARNWRTGWGRLEMTMKSVLAMLSFITMALMFCPEGTLSLRWSFTASVRSALETEREYLVVVQSSGQFSSSSSSDRSREERTKFAEFSGEHLPWRKYIVKMSQLSVQSSPPPGSVVGQDEGAAQG